MAESPSSFRLTDTPPILGFGAALAHIGERAEVARLLAGAIPSVVSAPLSAVWLRPDGPSSTELVGQWQGAPLADDDMDEIEELVSDVEEGAASHQMIVQASETPALAARGVRRMLATRIGTVDRTFGVAVAGRGDDTPYEATALAYLQMLGAQACIALHRIRADEERAAQEAALRESEARYRQLANAVFEGIVLVRDGIIVDTNAQFAEMLGYERAELVGRDPVDLAAPAYQDRAAEKIAAGDETPYESACLTKEGERVPVEVRGRMVEYRGQTTRVTAVRDITEQKKTERALRRARDELEERVEERTAELAKTNEELKAEIGERRQAQEVQHRQLLAMEAAMVGMSIHAEDGTFVYANQAHADIYGYDAPSELVGESWTMLYDVECTTWIKKHVIPELEAGKPWSGEIVGQKKSGEPFDVHLSLAPLDDGGLACVCQDITERKESEQALRQYANRLEILRAIDQAILSAQSPQEVAQAAMRRVRDVLPLVRSSVVLFDREAGEGEVLAYYREGATPLNVGVRIPLDDLRITDSVRAGEPEVVDDLGALDGTEVTDQLYREGVRSYISLPMIIEDELIGMVNIGAGHERAFGEGDQKIAREVADQLAIAIRQARLHEQVKQQTERLEQRVQERTAELESFTYSVSHDLRTPLRAIDGFTRMLIEDYEDDLDAEGQRLLNVVYESAQRMGRLIDDLLALSRLGRREMRTCPIDMEQLAREVVDELRRTEPDRDVEVDLQPLPPAEGDRAMVRQVFVNLVSNALKFTQHRRNARVEIGTYDAHDTTVYYVRDNGAGFDMEYADKLFGVFQRLHDDEEFEGTGVGLAVVERVIRRHEGTVWAEGAEGNGATFYFTLDRLDETKR
ncbi:MAG: PAS domain S-box protein [Bacteroidetes bacterium]|nr:PAS domain S-box protein [Bacteroidota bacterium]